jgi:hypothetical protein
MTTPSQPRTAWVQLYEARRIAAEPESRSPGRPPAPIPRHKVGLTLSQGETYELQMWQTRLSTLLGRKISIGETVGILTRICSARFNRLPNSDEISNLAQLAEGMVGNE